MKTFQYKAFSGINAKKTYKIQMADVKSSLSKKYFLTQTSTVYIVVKSHSEKLSTHIRE